MPPIEARRPAEAIIVGWISRAETRRRRESGRREVLSFSPPRLGLLRVSPAFQAETDPSVTTEDLGLPALAL